MVMILCDHCLAVLSLASARYVRRMIRTRPLRVPTTLQKKKNPTSPSPKIKKGIQIAQVIMGFSNDEDVLDLLSLHKPGLSHCIYRFPGTCAGTSYVCSRMQWFGQPYHQRCSALEGFAKCSRLYLWHAKAIDEFVKTLPEI